MNNKLHINTITMMVSFLLNMMISLVISPIIVEHVGSEAYAFVKMATDFTNYATIITVALNSVGARFITIAYHKNEKEEACRYFNSVLWSNLFLACIFSVIGAVLVINLENLIRINDSLVRDVKRLFLFMFLNFIISIICTVFTVATYITNTLYLSNIANAIANLIKILLIFGLFYALSPRVWILGFANAAFSLITGAANNLFRKRLIPEMKISVRYFSWKKTFLMLKSGIWSSVSSISNTLSDGLDLLITNLFINSVTMGQLSIAKTISSLISSLISTFTGLFAPSLTLHYARENKRELVREMQLAMKFTGFISSVFFCVFLMMGKPFFMLWVPSQNAEEIYVLAMLCIISILSSGIVAPLNNVFVLTNHLKINSIVWLCVSLFDILAVYILLKHTSLGGMAVAGVSSIAGMIMNLTYLPLITSYYLGVEIREWYRLILHYFITVFLGITELAGIRLMIHFETTTWMTFLGNCLVLSLVMLANNYLFFLNRKEKQYFRNRIRSRR